VRSTHRRNLTVSGCSTTVILVCVACLLGAATAEAQTSAEDVLEDAALIREALTPAWGSATVRMNGVTSAIRFARTDDGIDVFEPTQAEWVVGAEALATPVRLLALALGAQPIEDGIARLGLRLSVTSPVHVLVDGSALARRIGDDLAAVTFDAVLPRVREVAVRLDGETWLVRLRNHDGHGHGWFPSEVSIMKGTEPVLEFTLLDLARSRADLAPLPTLPPPPTRWAPARLPL
jgi:hypothetical protein